LADFNLYNMNGRLYDPVVGRFLSPDPFIQDPSFSQSYNRYSYALNNPLKFTDYSGEKWNWNNLNPFYHFQNFMQWINDKTPQLRQNMVKMGVPDFNVGYSKAFGPGYSVGDNPTYYPFYENKIVKGQQRISNQIAGFSGLWSNTGTPVFGNGNVINQQSVGESLAFGVTDDFTFAFGPGGISLEFGTFNYKGVEYSITSVGYAVGWDISAGINALLIRGNADTFNPNDLKGWSTQRNASYLYFSLAYEVPFERAYKPYNLDTYRTIIPGATIGITELYGASMVWGYTWIHKTPKSPTLTDLYKTRPGGY